MQHILVTGGAGVLGRLVVTAIERGRLSRAWDESTGQTWRRLAGRRVGAG